MNAQTDVAPVTGTDAADRSGARATRPRSGRRRILGTAGIAVAAALLSSACAAGQLAQTAREKSSIDGTNVTVGSIDIRGLSIQTPGTGSPAYAKGTAAQLMVVFVNSGTRADTLTSITSPSFGGWATFSRFVDASQVQQSLLSPSASSPAASSPAASSPAGSSPAGSAPLGSSPPGSSPAGSSSAGSSPVGAPGSSSVAGSPAASPSAGASATPLPKGTQTLTIAPGNRVGFGTPEATGALLLFPATKLISPGDTVSLTFTFSGAGAVTVSVPVQVSNGTVPDVLSGAPSSAN